MTRGYLNSLQKNHIISFGRWQVGVIDRVPFLANVAPRIPRTSTLNLPSCLQYGVSMPESDVPRVKFLRLWKTERAWRFRRDSPLVGQPPILPLNQAWCGHYGARSKSEQVRTAGIMHHDFGGCSGAQVCPGPGKLFFLL
jgi:hypothetical protein